MRAPLVSGLLVAVTIFGVVAPAAAQPSPPHAACVERTGTLDALVAANQSRSVERELQQLRRLYHWDRAAMREVLLEQGEETIALGGTLSTGTNDLAAFPLCYAGARAEATLQSVWLTLVASVEDHRREHGLRLILFAPQTKLSPEQELEDGPLSYVSYNQALFAIEGQFTRYFSVLAGWLTPRRLTVAEGVQGPDAARDPARAGQPMLQVGVPMANLYTNLILAPTGRAVETLYFDLRRLPLGETPVELSVSAGYLSHEDRVFSLVGAGWVFPTYREQWVPRVESRIGVEYGGARLREAALGLNASIPSIAFPRADLYGQLEAYATLTWFNSAWLERQTGARNVFGAEAGFRAGFGGDVAMLVLEPYVSLNRPETLSIFSSALGRFGWGTSLALRITPWFF